MDNEKVFKRALDLYGSQSQISMMIEECAELIQALIHFNSRRVTEEKVIDEIADVIIMSLQMRLIFGEEKIDNLIKEKIQKPPLLLYECECANFIQVLMHFNRCRVTEEKVIDKISNIMIMCQQLRFSFGEKEIDTVINEKVRRLSSRLDKYEASMKGNKEN